MATFIEIDGELVIGLRSRCDSDHKNAFFIALPGWACEIRTQKCRRKYPLERPHKFAGIQPNWRQGLLAFELRHQGDAALA
jgi:hypothetical protein